MNEHNIIEMAFQVTLKLNVKSHHRKCFDNIIIYVTYQGRMAWHNDITFLLNFRLYQISDIVVMHINKIYVQVV